MRLRPRRRREDLPPEGVCLIADDGTVIPCDVLRDPDQDKDGCAAWVAVPRKPVPPGMGIAPKAALLPPRTSLLAELRAMSGAQAEHYAAELFDPFILDEYEAIVPGARDRLLRLRHLTGDWQVLHPVYRR